MKNKINYIDIDWYRYIVSVFGQLSSKGRTGILSMVISWKFAQWPGAQLAFFVTTWQSLRPSYGTQGLFSCRDLCIGRRREKAEERLGKGK